MIRLSERDIRRSFVNCSKGEAQRLKLPAGLDTLPWPDLDFLGWRDPGAPGRAYLVAERADSLIGVALNSAPLWISRYVFGLEVPNVSLAGQELADFISGPVIGTLIAMGFRYWAMNRFVFPAQQTQPAEPATLDA